MDFFGYQEIARRRTGLLVFYYLLAVALIVAAVYLAYSLVFVYIATPVPEGGVRAPLTLESLWDSQRFVLVALAPLLVILLGSLYKTAQLSQGGRAVAALLGGRLLVPDKATLPEKKVLNVVEEMAIASGVPIPSVYVLDAENGINAFAAGLRPADTIIGITKGSVEKLSRSELQGVIAHEFSHILNSDMRLNIRLTGILHGILVIALIGFYMLRLFGRARSSSSKGGGGAAAVALFGILVMVIGYIGVFFAKLIKSAVSRQREFLADASAVQFTRDPTGIAGALKKIGGFSTGSRLLSPNAEQASHFFFANGLTSFWSGLMATHPPLAQRIRRLDPDFDPKKQIAPQSESDEPPPQASGFAGGPASKKIRIDSSTVAASVGAPRPGFPSQVRSMMAALPAEIADAVRHADQAESLMYASLLAPDRTVRESQLKILSERTEGGTAAAIRKLSSSLDRLDARHRLPVLELATGALKSRDKRWFNGFKETVHRLIMADEKIDLFEFCLQRMLLARLEPAFGKPRQQNGRNSIRSAVPEASVVLRVLSETGADNRSKVDAALIKASQALGFPLKAVHPDDPGFNRLGRALDTLAGSAPQVRKKVLEACTACVTSDGEITIAESELLRSVADSLDCPLPPFFDVGPGR